MKITIKKFKSKKGYLCTALCVNDVIVTFDKLTIMRVCDFTPNDFYTLPEGVHEVG